MSSFTISFSPSAIINEFEKISISRYLKNLELNIMNELPFVRECARKCHLRDRGVSYQQDLYRQCSKLHQLRYEPTDMGG